MIDPEDLGGYNSRSFCVPRNRAFAACIALQLLVADLARSTGL